MLIPSEIGYKTLPESEISKERTIETTSKNSKSKSSKTTTIAKRKSSEEGNSPLTKTLTRLENLKILESLDRFEQNCRLLKLSVALSISRSMFNSTSLLKGLFQFWIRSKTESAARSLSVSTGRCWIRVYTVTF